MEGVVELEVATGTSDLKVEDTAVDVVVGDQATVVVLATAAADMVVEDIMVEAMEVEVVALGGNMPLDRTSMRHYDLYAFCQTPVSFTAPNPWSSTPTPSSFWPYMKTQKP